MTATTSIFCMIATGYSLFFLVCFLAWKKGSFSLSENQHREKTLHAVNIKHIAGIISMGCPLIVSLKEWSHWLTWPTAVSVLQWPVSGFMMLLAGAIALKNAIGKSKNQGGAHPKQKEISSLAITTYLLIRITFLAVYECFFRGLFLITCFYSFGLVAAILINLICYAGIHVFGQRKETFACIPFGTALCSLSLWWQSLTPAILVHMFLALTQEIYLLSINTSSIKPIKQ
jgi:hypothetical protein